MRTFFVSILTLSLLLPSCQQTEISAEVETEVQPTTETHTSVFDFPPENATEVNASLLDLDGDGQPEELLTYRVDDVPVYHQTDTIYYLLVLRLENDLWTVIKEDQRGETTGIASEGKFCQVEVVRFDIEAKDFLLVSKCNMQGEREGYYLFGEIPNSPGTFGDLEIPKAYLDDPDIELTGVTAYDWGLVESYNVAESAQEERHCKQLSVSQLFNPQLDNGGFTLGLDSNGNAYRYEECTVWPPTLLETLDVDIETIQVGDVVGDWTVDSTSYDENIGGIINFSGEVQITGSFSNEEFKDWPELGLVCIDHLSEESALLLPSDHFCFINPEEALAAIEGQDGDVTFIIKDFVLDSREMETFHKTTFVSLVN